MTDDLDLTPEDDLSRALNRAAPPVPGSSAVIREEFRSLAAATRPRPHRGNRRALLIASGALAGVMGVSGAAAAGGGFWFGDAPAVEVTQPAPGPAQATFEASTGGGCTLEFEVHASGIAPKSQTALNRTARAARTFLSGLDASTIDVTGADVDPKGVPYEQSGLPADQETFWREQWALVEEVQERLDDHLTGLGMNPDVLSLDTSSVCDPA